MGARTGFTLALLLVLAVLCLGATLWIHRGFRARSTPAAPKAYLARKIRNLAIPASERRSKNVLDATADNLQQARELFVEHCSSCHGLDGRARTQLGENLYPRVPDLRAAQTQSLSDGELHYIIENGVQLTGMPAFTDPHEDSRRVATGFVCAQSRFGGSCTGRATRGERFRSLHRIAGLREMPRRDLQPVEEDANG
jgi:hypothetical protein